MARDGAGHAEIRKRAKLAEELYLNPEPAHLPAVPRPERDYRRASSVPTRCPFCSEWIPEGSRDRGCCGACGIPFDAPH